MRLEKQKDGNVFLNRDPKKEATLEVLSAEANPLAERCGECLCFPAFKEELLQSVLASCCCYNKLGLGNKIHLFPCISGSQRSKVSRT